MLFKYITFWLPLVAIGILNGTIRQFGYSRYMSELTAHQISTFSGIVLMGCYVWFIYRYLKIASAKRAWMVGITWLVLTIVFEFLFGHYVMGNPWYQLFHDYNLIEGRVWILVLIWITVAPYVMYKIRQ